MSGHQIARTAPDLTQRTEHRREHDEVAQRAEKEDEEEREVFKQYTIPEGFTVWIELAFKANSRPTSLF